MLRRTRTERGDGHGLLLGLAARMSRRGHVRLLGTVRGDLPVPHGGLVDLGSV